MLYKARPDLISRIATLDIGGEWPDDCVSRMFFLIYQSFLAFLFCMGSPFGDFFLQAMNGQIEHRPKSEIKAQMNYPYYYQYFGAKKQKGSTLVLDAERCPVYFGYGISKGKQFIQFHSDNFVKLLKVNESHGCRAVEFETDHYVMVEEPDQVNESLKKWFKDTDLAVHRKPD